MLQPICKREVNNPEFICSLSNKALLRVGFLERDRETLEIVRHHRLAETLLFQVLNYPIEEVRLTSLEKQIEVRFDASDQKHDGQFKALMSAIAESKAQAELTNMRMTAALSERVAVLESLRH